MCEADLQLAQLLGHHQAMLGVADDDRRGSVLNAIQSQHHVPQHRALAEQRQELLRQRPPRHRPQPRPGAAAESARMNYSRRLPILTT
jgi:hypothetical protein